MGKGIKMASAVDDRRNRHTLESLQNRAENGQTIPPLFCDGVGCSASVRFVKLGLRNGPPGKEPVERAAYIGLTSARDSDHATSCSYNATGKLKLIIANQSDPDFLSSLDEGKHELRLQLLHNALGNSDRSVKAGYQTGSKTKDEHIRTDYIRTGGKLDGYLRTTMDILKLRERCEEDTELSATLLLRFGNRKIPWRRFYFEQDRYEDAWKMLRKAEPSAHPFAIAGVVDRIWLPNTGSNQRNTFLNLIPERHKVGTDGIQLTYGASIGHTDQEWLQQYPHGTHVIAFGLWRASDPQQNSVRRLDPHARVKGFLNHQITLFPKFKSQVIKVEMS